MRPEGVSASEYNALSARAEQLHKKHPDCRRKDNIDFLLYLATVILVLLALRTFIGEPIQVDGPSMLPTLEDGERMLVEKVSYWFGEPQRGDIIICYYPGYEESCVKRVIGLPGETVQVVNGSILIDGSVLDERAYWRDWIDEDMDPVTVPEDSVFVVGDNRNWSKDSRAPDVGCIPYEEIMGRAICVFWPQSGMRALSHDVY